MMALALFHPLLLFDAVSASMALTAHTADCSMEQDHGAGSQSRITQQDHVHLICFPSRPLKKTE